MPGPLDGYRVLDLSTIISGPFATMLLGDQGADVIKVETPGIGDLLRLGGNVREGISPFFATSNRNKRSIVVNLKEKRGIDLLLRLVEKADVFVQNFRPGAIERMGLGEEALRAVRPDLVYVSISGFGENGPYARRRVYDPIIQALSGLMAAQGDETGRPQTVRTILPDKLTAVTAAQAITAALLARERTGEGQHVKLSMLDATVAWLWPDMMRSHTWVENRGEMDLSRLKLDFTFATADGWIAVIVISDMEWAGLGRAAGHPEWAEDDRFRTLPDRITHIEEMIALVDATLRTASTADWLERLEREEVPCAPVRTLEEMMVDEQVRANGLIVESDHPHVGRMREPRPAVRFDRTPAMIRRPAPCLGEHTAEVLAEAGLSDGEIASLRDAGIVG